METPLCLLALLTLTKLTLPYDAIRIASTRKEPNQPKKENPKHKHKEKNSTRCGRHTAASAVARGVIVASFCS